ncbi:hypothetical protein KP509_34G057900 [Ceratopteris richardii]|nr:hypothetical protein KP509_34G057900 [Ceratopteris richardii]
MEILGHTLAAIAGEKAGIFKAGTPAFTVGQEKEAMDVLQMKASELDIRLQVVSPLNEKLLNGSKLSMEGDHQLSNAALAVALCRCWAERQKDEKHVTMFDEAISMGHLPEPYIKGLVNARFLGRAQHVQDPEVQGLSFFLDGAHSPESMEACGKWFCSAMRKLYQMKGIQPEVSAMGKNEPVIHASCDSSALVQNMEQSSKRVLLFNCMPQRDPSLLLPPLINLCDINGLPFHHAMFVPGLSSYVKVNVDLPVASKAKTVENDTDLSWQYSVQRVWDSFTPATTEVEIQKKATEWYELHSCVIPSLPAALDLLRQYCREHSSLKLQVLVTGSLHLVGDVLRLLKR